MDEFIKLAPFMRRAGQIEVGRERLAQVRKQLLCLLVTEDLSDNSLRKIIEDFDCPVYRHFNMADIERLFGYSGTKILGFRRSSLSSKLQGKLKPWQVHRVANGGVLLPQPRVAVLGASGIGRHHANWWRLEGARVCAFLGSSEESVARTAATLREYCDFAGRGYCSLTELLATEKPDIVDVCLPPALHYAAVKESLLAGCHVLCEKPFVFDETLSAAEMLGQVDELSELARSQRCLLGVCTQYVMAVKECLKLWKDGHELADIEHFYGRLVSPTRNRPPVPQWTWVDLAPHMLGMCQVLAEGAEPDWETLKTRFAGHLAEAEFTISRANGKPLCCHIHTFHTDTEPKNVRQVQFNEQLYDIGGFRDEQGVFQMEIACRDGKSEKREDMLRLLIRSFLRGRTEMGPEMARQNLDWMLRVIRHGLAQQTPAQQKA
ncbi:MAG: Gfo/Idh/MocA family protein [Lentisphaeria bacterium]|jgi:predicted dehydrogenase